METKVRIGILGCANIAKKYAINAFKSINNAELICIASRSKEKAENTAKEYGIPSAISYNKLINCEDIDAIYIPLPIGLHEKWIKKAAIAGKHIICEKSLSYSYASVKRILNICNSNNIVLYENFMCDFHPQHKKVLSTIADGQIGRPIIFRGYFGFPPLNKSNFRYNKFLGGGSLNDAGSYPTFMARKIFGLEPVAVTSSLNFDEQTGVDIQGSAYLEFPEAKVGLIAFGFDNVYQNNYSVWGSEGILTVSRAYSIPPDMRPEVKLFKNISSKEVISSIEIPAANHFELIFKDFCNTLLNKDKKKIDRIYSSLSAQARVLEAIRISARENRKVKIDEIRT